MEAKDPSVPANDVEQDRPRKRALTPTSDHDQKKRHVQPKAPETVSAKPFEIMKLPAEVRLNILRNLLVCSKPLRIEEDPKTVIISRRTDTTTYDILTTEPGVKSFCFCAAILRTCRTIYNEGMPLLYEQNTVYSSVDMKYHLPTRMTFFHDGKPYHFRSTVPPTLRLRLQRVHIRLDIPAVIPNPAYDQFCRENIRVFITQFKSLPNLRHLTVDTIFTPVNDDPALSSADQLARADAVLRPFALFRRLKSVTFTGTVPSNVKSITELITGDSPVADLPNMYQTLSEHVNRMIEMFKDWSSIQIHISVMERDILNAYDCMDNHDLPGFLRLRNTMLKRLDDLYVVCRQGVHSFDPHSLPNAA